MTRADRDRIRAEVEASSRNRDLPEIPDAEKMLKRFHWGHEAPVHPGYYIGEREICENCGSKPSQIGSDWWHQK